MSNLIDYNTIQQTIVSNSTQRLVSTSNNKYYWWNDYNQSYNFLVDTSFSNSQAVNYSIEQVDSDNAGNFYFLTSAPFSGPFSGSQRYYLWNWNSSSPNLEGGIWIPYSKNANYKGASHLCNP